MNRAFLDALHCEVDAIVAKIRRDAEIPRVLSSPAHTIQDQLAAWLVRNGHNEHVKRAVKKLAAQTRRQ